MTCTERPHHLLAKFVVSGVLLAACGDSVGNPASDEPACPGFGAPRVPIEGAPTFEEYVNRATKQFGDRWIVEDDLLATNETELRKYYEQVFTRPAQPGEATTSFRSTVLCKDGNEQIWNAAQKLNITYCFGFFPDRALGTSVRTVTEDVVRQFERAGDVNFVLMDMTDEECENSDVDRIVRQGTANTCALILGTPTTSDDCFDGFANAPGDGNNVWIFPGAFDDEADLRGTVLHEFGHVLGLAHEHKRWIQEAGSSCETSSSHPARAVTDRDSSSVMGYSQCPGSSTSGTILSPLDRAGIALLYNLPRTGPARFDLDTAEANMQDILWHKPGQDELEHWVPIPNGGGVIDFVQTTISYASLGGDPVTDFPSRWRPFPVRTSDFPTSDVFLFGPGELPDLVLEQLSSIQETPPLSGPFDNPVVGRFIGGSSRQDIWFVSPGALPDPVVDFDGAEPTIFLSFDSSIASDGYYIGLPGLFREDDDSEFSNAPDSQVLWYRPLLTGTGTFRLTRQQTTLLDASESAVDPACFLDPGREYIPYLGEFDGDSQQEIFWFSPSDGEHVLWREIDAMWSTLAIPCSNLATVHTLFSAFPDGEFKPFIGDFNNDSIDDLFWYRPGDSNDDFVWLFDSDDPDVVNQIDAPPSDATPIVGDYNGDGCEDILWYVPQSVIDTPTTGDESESTSSLWRSLCNGTFAIEPDITTPVEAYPIGYNPRQGRAIP